jgi:hypothetical protein
MTEQIIVVTPETVALTQCEALVPRFNAAWWRLKRFGFSGEALQMRVWPEGQRSSYGEPFNTFSEFVDAFEQTLDHVEAELRGATPLSLEAA